MDLSGVLQSRRLQRLRNEPQSILTAGSLCCPPRRGAVSTPNYCQLPLFGPKQEAWQVGKARETWQTTPPEPASAAAWCPGLLHPARAGSIQGALCWT